MNLLKMRGKKKEDLFENGRKKNCGNLFVAMELPK